MKSTVKNKAASVKPYHDEGSKKDQVAIMFNNIAHRYDLLNRSLSMGIDVLWRRRMISKLQDLQPKMVLDVATGTGDVAIECMKLHPSKVVGIDISVGMLKLGREKVSKRGLAEKIELLEADSENLPFADNTFDAVTVAFGVRNFEHLLKGLSEICRVLRPDGRIVVLEFSRPERFPVKQLYWFYFDHVLPLFGRMLSKDKAAYTYLPRSVKAFPDGDDFLKALEQSGFTSNTSTGLTFGIASIYTGSKA